MSTECDHAWLAGFLDGEGTIQLHSASTQRYILHRVSFPNTNEVNMRKVKVVVADILGRELRYQPEKGRAPQNSILYLLKVARETEIGVLLRAVLPYLSGKRPQAELMLRYLEIAPGRGVGHYYDDRHFAMAAEMKHLNRRAVVISQQEAERLVPLVG